MITQRKLTQNTAFDAESHAILEYNNGFDWKFDYNADIHSKFKFFCDVSKLWQWRYVNDTIIATYPFLKYAYTILIQSKICVFNCTIFCFMCLCWNVMILDPFYVGMP